MCRTLTPVVLLRAQPHKSQSRNRGSVLFTFLGLRNVCVAAQLSTIDYCSEK